MSVQRLVNSFGAMTMAGYTAAVKIDSIAIAPIVSVGSALSVFSGQNIGANQMDRIKKGMYQTLASLIGICIVIAAGIVLFRNQLLGLFLDKTQALSLIHIYSINKIFSAVYGPLTTRKQHKNTLITVWTS